MNIPSPLIQLRSELLEKAELELWVKRDDLIHEDISGNKWRKLVHNLEQAKEQGYQKILTFGGAFSNHIAAVGAIAAITDFEIHAMIRGDELNENSNQCLQKASQQGLKLHFVNRSFYRQNKKMKKASDISDEWGEYYLIPEGGANEAGVKGCEEIMNEIGIHFDHMALSAGTGTTAAGILRNLHSTKLLVYPALKGAEFMKDEILSWQKDPTAKSDQLELVLDYHFGGFAKVSNELIDFAKHIHSSFELPLDYLYTAKAFYGLMDRIESGQFEKGSKILFYHSGGLQGNNPFE